MSPRLIEPEAYFSSVLVLLTGNGLILIHEDGIELVVELLCGVFGDDLRCGGVLGVLGRGGHVGSVTSLAPLPIRADLYSFCITNGTRELPKRSCEEWDHMLFYFTGPTPRCTSPPGPRAWNTVNFP